MKSDAFREAKLQYLIDYYTIVTEPVASSLG